MVGRAKLLSKAGRLTLIKFFLINLNLFYLSLFKMPKGVAKKIIALQSNFFWGGKEGRKAVPFVKWDVILGGLGVREMLLCFLNVGGGFLLKTPLWKKVVCSCHSLIGNRLIAIQTQSYNGGL